MIIDDARIGCAGARRRRRPSYQDIQLCLGAETRDPAHWGDSLPSTRGVTWGHEGGPDPGQIFHGHVKQRIDIRYRSNGGSFMKKEHSCTHLKKWKTKMTSTVQTLRRKMSGILFVLLLQHKKKLILVKNNETETCVKLDPNRILEVEIKINICKIQSKHDKAIFPTHAI